MRVRPADVHRLTPAPPVEYRHPLYRLDGIAIVPVPKEKLPCPS